MSLAAKTETWSSQSERGNTHTVKNTVREKVRVIESGLLRRKCACVRGIESTWMALGLSVAKRNWADRDESVI